MNLNKYLRIKTAGKYIPTKPTPTAADWYATQDDENVIADMGKRVKRIYDKLAENSGKVIPHNCAPGLVIDPSLGFNAMTPTPFMSTSHNTDTLLGVPSLVSFLHENGHQYDFATNPDHSAAAIFARSAQPYANGDKMGADRLMLEQNATNYARDLANSITDEKLRNRLLYHVNGILNPSYLTYFHHDNPYLQGRKLGRNYGRNIGMYGGALTGGIGGYIFGDYLGKSYLGDGWKRRLAGLAGGLIGAGVLGYVGNRIGNTVGGYTGQYMADRYTRTPEYTKKYDQILRIINKAHTRELKDTKLLDDLEQYLGINS